MANIKDEKVYTYPKLFLKNWEKNNNPMSGFIYTKKIKGFIPSKSGFTINNLFVIDTKEFKFQNSEKIKTEYIKIYKEFSASIDNKILVSLGNEIQKIFSNRERTLDFQYKISELQKISDKFSKDKKTTSNLIKYLIYIYFSNTNFASCYFFKELRANKVEKINSTKQRFLIKNEILLLSTILKKTKKQTHDLINLLFPNEVNKAELDKEIELFEKQVKFYNNLFDPKNFYDIKFSIVNPQFMMPLLNVPLGTELYKKFPLIYIQIAPDTIMSVISNVENKEGANKDEELGKIVINDIISRKNVSTEMYWYRGAIINFLKIIKPEKLDEWFDKKDYPILLRKSLDGKEEIVKIADDFVAKFNKELIGIKSDNSKKNVNQGSDHLTTDIDSMY